MHLFGAGFGTIFSHTKTERLLSYAASNNFVEAHECATAYEQDVGGINRGEFLVGVLAAALRRHVGNRALENLEQRLLHAFAGHVASNGWVLILAADLVYLVNIDNASLRATYVALSCLQQLEDDVFDIFADVSGFGESRGVHDGEGNVQHPSQCLRKQRLACTSRADQHDVGLGKLDAVPAIALTVHVDPLVMVVNRNRQLLLGLFLADDVFIEKRLDFLWLGKLIGSGGCRRRRTVVFKYGITNGHALVANISARVVARRGD